MAQRGHIEYHWSEVQRLDRRIAELRDQICRLKLSLIEQRERAEKAEAERDRLSERVNQQDGELDVAVKNWQLALGQRDVEWKRRQELEAELARVKALCPDCPGWGEPSKSGLHPGGPFIEPISPRVSGPTVTTTEAEGDNEGAIFTEEDIQHYRDIGI